MVSWFVVHDVTLAADGAFGRVITVAGADGADEPVASSALTR